MSGFYTFGGFATIEAIPAYRENIRRIIPFPLQEYFQSACYEIVIPDNHFLLDCPPPDEAEDLAELATMILADAELRRDLRYMLSYAGVSAGVASNRMKRAKEVLEILATHTDSKGA